MESAPILTVAIPTYNGARHIADALRSILSQERSDFALLVSDDRSDDATLALVRSQAGDRARIVVNSERLGLAGNWNQCVALSQSPLVTIFHQDDFMRPGHLAAHLGAFEAASDIGMVASAVEMVGESGETLPTSVVESGGLGKSDQRFPPRALLPELALANPLRCSGVTLLAEAHRRLGGFDASYRYVVDWEFWLRMARQYKVVWLSKPTVAMRWHLASETHRFKNGIIDLQETERLLETLLTADFPGTEGAAIRRKADRRLARAYLNRSYEALKTGHGQLAKQCLQRSLSLSPAIIKTIVRDPRLALQMGLLSLAPRVAGSLLSRRGDDGH